MKILFSYILAGFTLMSVLTGCIKDNSNIKGLVIQNPGIGFPFGANNKNDIIIRPATSSQKVSGLLLVTLEAAAAASSDIHISIADNSTALVNAYNLANGTAIQPLPGSLWSIPAELIIKSGDRYSLADITINNTSGINLSQQYAIGISITGVSGENKIAGNLKNLFIVFSIQNTMDGMYSAKGQFYHPTINPGFTSHSIIIELQTTGPNSVRAKWPVTGYIVPYFDASGIPFVGLPFLELTLQRSQISNNILCYNSSPGTIVPWEPLLSYGNNIYNNRWDSAGGKFYLAWGWNIGPPGIFVPGTTRAWIDTLTYLGPR
jgi:Domain of unknown function (DUF1735)